MSKDAQIGYTTEFTLSLSEILWILLALTNTREERHLGYEFTRHFGEVESNRPATCLCVRVMVLAMRGQAKVDMTKAFSFPLSGCSQED